MVIVFLSKDDSIPWRAIKIIFATVITGGLFLPVYILFELIWWTLCKVFGVENEG